MRQTIAKRYWHPEHCSDAPEALTLIFAHGTGFVKEHWEPTLEDLYDAVRDANTRGREVQIREAWSIEASNHGDSAALNEEVLMWGYTPVFAWEEYARSIHAFLTGLGKGVDIDFFSRNLVGVGHSMGAIALMLVDTYMPQITFSSLILVDPMLLRKPLPEERELDLETGAVKRRDIWPSREEALSALQSRPSFKIWDPRILKIFVDQGLRDLPTAIYPDKTGVTLKCPKEYEAACYRDRLTRVRAYRYLATLCLKLPVHIIYGAIDDYLPKFIKDDVLNVAAQGKYASVARVEGAGHLVPQMQPRRLANAIHSALVQNASGSKLVPKSKL
ncbi:hypothetical protein NM688_g3260 [Phlebia brevispora]|uniref:Uncharacterized protein n=1 Tax=Phlebia brevispora TaxID=194682 RepID=A0ACC1T694_9APHY|nr:hypothetical protein NM688_g3260 [Phlebia brevispora]